LFGALTQRRTGVLRGPRSSLVLCTGAALRRPSVWLSVVRKEGCFSPASCKNMRPCEAVWNNRAGRGPATHGRMFLQAGL
jgi:hypothetical protein